MRVRLALALRRPADAERARDIGMISLVDGTVVHRHEVSLLNDLLRRRAVRQRPALAGGDDGRKRRPLRAVGAHIALHVRRHLELRDAGAQEREDILVRRIGDLACLADLRDLPCILDLAQGIEIEVSCERALRQAAGEIAVPLIRHVLPLKADALRTERREELCRPRDEAVLLLHELVARRLLPRLLRVAVVRDKELTRRRHHEHRIIPAEAAEIHQVHFFGHDDRVESLLSEQGAQCFHALFKHPSAPHPALPLPPACG